VAKTTSNLQQHFIVTSMKAVPFNNEQQVAFESQLVCAFVSAGWSWNSMDDIEVWKLFAFLNASTRLPHQKQLSGTLLKQEVAKAEGGVKGRMKGEYATIQCDGWKDVSRFNLVVFMFTTLRQVCC
jgi:hypothetical protein